MWAETASRGWSETPEAAAFIREFGPVSAGAKGIVCFVAEWNGEPDRRRGAGDARRRRGARRCEHGSTVSRPWCAGRLLLRRLSDAASSGCDLAMMGALPGSASQRNGERQGFRIAYTRIKWQHDRASVRRSPTAAP